MSIKTFLTRGSTYEVGQCLFLNEDVRECNSN